MRVLLLTALVWVLPGLPATAEAQASRGTADTVAQRYLAVLLPLRDTLRQVSASLEEFRRDLQAAGDETVVARARGLTTACAGARPLLTDALPMFAADRVPPRARDASRAFRSAIQSLTGALDEHCQRGLAPSGPGARPDSLRAWGPYRTAQLRETIGVYHTTLQRFAKAAGFRLPVPSGR